MNSIFSRLDARAQESLMRFLRTDPNASGFITALATQRDSLLAETMKSGVTDARAAEFRYTARGLNDVLDCLQKVAEGNQ